MTRALVTGGHGFLGRAIVRELTASGAAVDILGRSPSADIASDLAEGPPSLTGPYDLAVHAAGKAHVVPATDDERDAFYRVNEHGTRHLLAALDALERLPTALVFVSTVAVYGREVADGLAETDPLSASDPYGASKAAAERLVTEWGAARGVRVAVLRLPLVAGPSPPGNLGAMLGALRAGRYLGVGDGTARRSVVLTDDVAGIVQRAAEVGGTYNLTDGVHPSFVEIEGAMAQALGVRRPRRLPRWLAAAGGRVGDAVHAATGWRPPLTSRTVSKMTSSLTMDDGLARQRLGWSPQPVLSTVDAWSESGA